MSFSLRLPPCIFLQQSHFIFHLGITAPEFLEMIRPLSIVLLAIIIAYAQPCPRHC